MAVLLESIHCSTIHCIKATQYVPFTGAPDGICILYRIVYSLIGLSLRTLKFSIIIFLSTQQGQIVDGATRPSRSPIYENLLLSTIWIIILHVLITLYVLCMECN